MTISDDDFDRIDDVLARARDGIDVRDEIEKLPKTLATEIRALLASDLDVSTSRGPIAWSTRGSAAGVTSEALGPYRIVQELGRGAQGTVYLAEDTRLGRRVALKVLDRFFGSDSDVVERFQREARAASQLRHPSICEIYEVGVVDRIPYIAMAYAEGRTLAAILAEERASHDGTAAEGRAVEFDAQRKLRIVAACARALHVAHEAGIVHRDVKPGNIVIDREGLPRLLDFGLARIESDPTLTGTREFLGTPAYAAPEVFAGRPADRRTDVYSLGITLYEWLSGRRPYQGPTIEALSRAIATGGALSVDRIMPGCSKELALVVATAMDVDPNGRYATAAAFADDLENILATRPVSVRPIGTLSKSFRWVRRNPLVASLVGGIILALSIGLAVSLTARSRAEADRKIAEERGEALQRSLDEIADLSDRKLASNLQSKADSLWPPLPLLIPSFEGWLADAARLRSRKEIHRRAAAELEKRALPYTEERRAIEQVLELEELARTRAMLPRAKAMMDDAGTEAEEERAILTQQYLESNIDMFTKLTSTPVVLEFATEREAWRHDLSQQTVQAIDALERPDGAIARIERRLTIARNIAAVAPTVADRWPEVRRRLAADRRFDGFEFEPPTGFVSLGPDPTSGLEEFLVLVTHEGPLPTRDAEGRLALDESCGLILVLLPGGTFELGSNDPDPELADTAPTQEIELAPFYISKFEMTQAQWRNVTLETPSEFKPGSISAVKKEFNLRHPVEMISWLGAERLLANIGLTLPTEAQWEYAARAGTTTPWSFGDNPLEIARYGNVADASALENGWSTADGRFDDGWDVHAPVGTYLPNAFGLYDVHGNVFEWCEDAYGRYDAPTLFDTGRRLQVLGTSNHVFRGGAFNLTAQDARSDFRRRDNNRITVNCCGLRPSRPAR